MQNRFLKRREGKKMKKIFLSLGVITFIVLLGISYLRAQGVPVPFIDKVTYQENSEESDFSLVGHAGGSLNVEKDKHAKVTNAKEAFEQNYDQGLRLFEVDLVFTEDGELIARHDWKSYLYEKFLGQKDIYKNNQPLSYKEVMSMPIHTKYHSIDLKGLLDFLSSHKDASLIIDSKIETKGDLEKVYKKIVMEAQERGEEALLERIIPQIYATTQYESLKAIYPFSKIILTLYKSTETREVIGKFLESNHPLFALTMSETEFKKYEDLRNIAHKEGIKIFVHTIDSLQNLEIYKNRGADGIYTNTIRQYTEGWMNIETKEKIKASE